MTLITRLSVWAFMLCAVTIQAQTTYYSKATATDFNDVNSWGTNTDGSGTSPGTLSSPDIYIIQNAAALSLSANAAIGKLTITSGSLTVSANQLDVAITSQNNSTLLVNGGTLNLSGTGAIVLNGNLSVTSGTFNQSGGAISIDGNNNNVAATSVASGTHLCSIGGTINCSAGTITIIDPPVNTYTIQSTRAVNISTSASNTAFSGTHTFILGDGVSTTVGNTDGFSVECYASSRVPIQNLTVNAGNGTGRWASSSSSSSTLSGTYIKGTLTINTDSEFRINPNSTTPTELMIGSIVNNGIFTTSRAYAPPVLNIGGHASVTGYTPTTSSLISGTGIFRNLATSPTATFGSIIFNNPLGISFDTGTLALGTYAGHVSGTMTLTAGAINTNGQEFILGVGTGTLGTLTYTAGGFTSGSTFGRWYAAATAGTTITASTSPTFGTGSYPFVSGINNRSFHINRPASTGATGGILKVTYTDGIGMASITPVTDGTYSIDKQSNANWTVATGATFAAGSGTFTYAINGQGIYSPINTNGRLLKNGTLVGTHQTGTTVPIVQRSVIPAASFTGTFNVGLYSSDIPAQTIQSGAWEDPATWGGAVPTCTIRSVVASGHTVTVSASTTGNCSALNIEATGSLLVTGGSLTIGCTNNNALLINNGTLNVSGGTLSVNGNISNPSGSTFTQSGGDIIVDGNNGNTTATSVATGTALVSFATNNVNLTGGKLTVVDPHAGAGTETAIAYTPSTTPYPNVTIGHTVQFGDGVSTTTGGSISGFRITQGTRLSFGNIIVNTLSGRYVYSSGNIPILGDLTTANGEFQIQSGQTNAIAGNIINNGTLSTIGTLYFGTYTLPSTLSSTANAQTVSGTGIFKNAATSTANFASITINNTNAAGVTFVNANSLLNGTNTGTVSGTLTFTTGSISTGANEFVLGTAVGTLGTLSYTAGGFTSGSKFTRWFPTATSSTAIFSATLTSPSGGFPFSSSAGVRALILQQATAPTLGGKISVVYNANGGGTTASSIVDGTYTVETRSKESWVISTNGITGTPTYNLAISAQNLYNAANGNSRVTLAAAPATGTHQTGTNYPHAQRTGITLAALADTYYIGASNADIPFISIATGNWEDGTTWNKGVAPSCTDAITIGSGHNVTVNATAGACQRITINTGATLTVAGSSLTNGCTLNNNALTNNGTLTVTGGTLNINGNLICAAGSTFNQSGGDINIDGNGGATGTNVASGVSLCQLSTPNINWTGGNLTIIDPHANATASESFTYTNSTTHVNVTSGHTLRLGDGISADAGGNATNGFRINTWPGSNRISFNNVEINTGTGTNRHVTTTYSFGINGDCTITSGEFRDNTTTVYFAKNLTNNGTYISTGVVYLGTFLGGTVGVSSSTQTVSGVGTFSNNVTIASKTADVSSLTINNNNATGITLDRSLSVSGTLTMTSGVTSINPSNILSIGTATAAGTLTGTPSVTNMLKGTFARTFAASRTATGTYSNATLFPLGSGSSYLPIWIDPTIASTGASIVSATTFDTNSGTTGAGVSGLSPFRWEYSNTAANLTSAFFRISQTGLNNGKAFVQSTSAAGAYDPIVGVTSTVTATNLTSSSIPVGTMTGFLSYGDLTPCIAPADQATNWVSTAIGTTTLSASYTAATSTPTGYIVVRYPTGSTPTNPVDLTTYATGNALGTGTVVYFGAATSFSATGLVANTTYDFYVYDYNNSGCAGPIYNTVAPLLSTVTTCASVVTAPTSSAGTAITTTGFTANWTASTTVGVTDYFIDISTSSTYATLLAGYPLSVSTATSYSVTGLSPNTTYYYRVRANVGVCSSTNSTSQTVVTDCAGEVAPTVVQPFTTYLPSCWKEATGALTASTVVTGTTSAWATETGFGNTGTNPAVRINLYNTKNDWVISQPIDLGAGGYRIQYKMGVTSYLGTTAQTTLGTHKVDIVVSTDAGATWSNANIVKTYTGAGAYSATGQIETIDLIGYTGVVKIGFLATTTSTTPDIDFHIDDFEVIAIPSCINPSGLSLSTITTTSADFSWAAPLVGNPPTGYNWEIRTLGAGGSGATGLVDAGTTTNTFASSTLLSANTAYSIYVQSDCSAGNTSTWFGPFAITTPCASVTLPVIQDFEGSTTLTNCWKSVFISGTKAFSIGTTTTAAGTSPNPAAQQGTNRLLFPSYSTSGNQTRLVSPPIDASNIASIDAKFQWYESTTGGATSYLTEGVQVQYSFDGINWTNSGSLYRRYGATTGWFSKTENIAGNVPLIYIGFLFTSNAGYDSYIDAINIEVGPTCQNPTAITTTGITGNSVDFTWNAPALGTSPVAYNWEIRTSGVAGSGATGLIEAGAVATNAATSTLLSATTTYSIYVQSDCSTSGISSWFGPFTFTTPCATVATFPYLETFTTFLPGCWNNYGQGGTPATGPTVTTTGSWTADGFINSGTTGATKVNLYSNTINSWLISPTFNLSNVNATYQLKYKVGLTTWNGTAAATLGSDDEVQTLISTNGGATWSSLKSYTASTVVSNTGVTEFIDLTGYASNNVKIAFWATEGTVDDTPDNDFFLDDVAVIELTNCSGTPAAAVASSTSSSVCAGSDIVLNATGLIDSQNGLVYQWQSSDNGGASWTDFSTPITFKTNSTVTVTAVSVNTSFRLLATCTASGNLSNPSNTVDIAISTVTGGSTIASATSVCNSTTTSNTTLSLIGATAGVTYQWQSSPNGTTFTNITGATNATYAATVSTPTYFQCVVTCGASTATSSPVSITLKAANQCYCIPVSAGSSCISNVKIGTIDNTSAACASPWYSVQSATTNINKGANYQISVTTVDAAIISVWIDYNQNGTFEASEWKQVATASTANVASVVTLNIPSTALLGSTGMRIRSRATLNPNGSTDACTTFASGECEDYYITIVDPITTVTAKTYLNNVDQATGIMDDYVKTLANFSLSDPYSSAPLNANFTHVNSGATATTTPAVLAVTGNNAIVDWVFLELRTGASGATTVQYTKAALLQKDGDIVDVDGVSPVAFPNAPAGNYFVAVRHRNHLGCRTDNLIALSNATPTLNFTNGTVPLYGSTPVTIVSPSLSFMNGGDSNSDGSINAFDTILWEIQNGLFDDYTNNSDYNLDGSVDAFDTIIWELNNGKYQELD